MISDEEGKAVQEIAKAAGKSIDAGSKMGGFIAKYIGGSLEQGMGIWEDKLKYRRWENQIRLAEKAKDFLQARGLDGPTRTIELSLAIPLLEEGSLADSDVLQDRWAMLLANAADANGPDVRRAYVGILSEMTPQDASILDMIFDADAANPPGTNGDRVTIGTGNLPSSVSVPAPKSYVDSSEVKQQTKQPLPEYELSLVNLGRLGLICSAAVWGGMANMCWVSMTELGRQFVIACRPEESDTTD